MWDDTSIGEALHGRSESLAEITSCSAADRLAWDAFVDAQEQCSLYHAFGWKEIIEQAYGHRCSYLLARNREVVTGILPLTLIKSRLFGSSLTSLPYLDFAGLVAIDDASGKLLLEHARQLARDERVDYLELRQLTSLSDEYHTDTRKVTFTLELPPDIEQLWNALPSERRNRIRKATRAGLTVEFAAESALPVFYRVWTENMRDLGSPAHSLSFFRAILRAFGTAAQIALVKFQDEYIGSALCLHQKGRFVVPWVSSLRKHFRLYPNNILYWEAMKRAIEENCRIFDFGRSTVDSGTYTFKRRWKATPQPLYWQFPYSKSHEYIVPATDSPKYQLALNLWKKLPVGLTKIIGPPIRKNITA